MKCNNTLCFNFKKYHNNNCIFNSDVVNNCKLNKTFNAMTDAIKMENGPMSTDWWNEILKGRFRDDCYKSERCIK